MNGNGMKASSSQRSIYDYPEHLNPFYEDENHKRLRFWKLGREKKGRSNSFSIDGLKGLWSFKTFKLKKKSSTLGINKTSESPPMLRRDEDHYGSQTTYDGRLRHTVDVGLGNNFQRGVAYRSSLQDLNSVNRNQGENFFIRNNRYRSTIQPGTSGSVTPVFRSRYNQPSMSRGSSQLSVNSTNPFEEDYETISQVGSPERSSIRHSARKKRRAPAPPVSPNKTITTVEESTEAANPSETVNITSLTAEIETFVRTADTDQETIPLKQAEATNSANEVTNSERSENIKLSRQSPESNDYYPQEAQEDKNVYVAITIDKIENLGETDVNSNERIKKSPVKILIRAPSDEEPILAVDEETKTDVTIEYVPRENVTNENAENENVKIENVKNVNDVVEIENVNENVENEIEVKDTERDVIIVESVRIEKTCDTEKRDKEVELPKEKEYINVIDEIQREEATTPTSTAVEFILENDNKTPTSTAVEFILENNNRTIEESDDLNELKITESTDNLTKVEAKSVEEVKETKENHHEANGIKSQTDTVRNGSVSTRFEVRTVPLKGDIDDSPILRRARDGSKEPPTPPQRRRSVKEIIESINKCQSLLKINQDLKSNKAEKEKINNDLFVASTSSFKSFKGNNNFIDRNMNDTAEKDYKNKKMFSDVEVNNNGEDMSHIPLFVEKFNELNSNNDANAIFEKCVVRNSDGKVSNLEWNPVPKPRRHRNSTQGSIN